MNIYYLRRMSFDELVTELRYGAAPDVDADGVRQIADEVQERHDELSEHADGQSETIALQQERIVILDTRVAELRNTIGDLQYTIDEQVREDEKRAEEYRLSPMLGGERRKG